MPHPPMFASFKKQNSVSYVIDENAQWQDDSSPSPFLHQTIDVFETGDFEAAMTLLRGNIIGRDQILEGPFGPRLKLYLDYTASGQGLHFINTYMKWIRENFANTHTEDSATGRFMTDALHMALRSIEECVNAKDQFVAIATGTGCTGALLRLQQILGIYIPPASWATLALLAGGDKPVSRAGWPKEAVPLKVIRHDALPDDRRAPEWLRAREKVKNLLRSQHALPLVLVGGYEHHSNEISWMQGLCDVCRVPLTEDYWLDLAFLEDTVQRHRDSQPDRVIIGSFSACSNVTGMNTDLRAVSSLLRRYGARFFVDFAASGPYVEIDCCPKDCPDLFDGFVLSPHKFLGGDGSCGLLVLRKSVYDTRLPPTFAGGGTVRFVGQTAVAFSEDIVERENAGTPGALQIFQCALAFELKRALGPSRIEERELALLLDFFGWLKREHLGSIFVLGNQDPALRHPIVSFNVIGPTPLAPRFVTVLLSDLFGVQTRAGCSCAGPHGVDLLNRTFDEKRANELETMGYVVADPSAAPEEARDVGLASAKPGWCRLNLHYTLDVDEVWYLKEVLSFVVKHGASFLSVYSFDAVSGAWEFRPPEGSQLAMGRAPSEPDATSPSRWGAFSLATALRGGAARSLHDLRQRRRVFEETLRSAQRLASELPSNVKLGPPPAPFPCLVLSTHGPQPHFFVAEGQVHNFEEMVERVGRIERRQGEEKLLGEQQALARPGVMGAAAVAVEIPELCKEKGGGGPKKSSISGSSHGCGVFKACWGPPSVPSMHEDVI